MGTLQAEVLGILKRVPRYFSNSNNSSQNNQQNSSSNNNQKNNDDSEIKLPNTDQSTLMLQGKREQIIIIRNLKVMKLQKNIQ